MWPLCSHRTCRLFRNDGWRYCRGSGASLRNLVGRHTDATQFLYLHNIMLLPLHSVGANIGCHKLISSSVFPPLLSPLEDYSVFPFLVVTMSVFVSILTRGLPCKICMLVSQSARKICKFVFASCNEVDVIY